MNPILLTADGGSTKTDWLVRHDDGIRQTIRTRGTNPFMMNAAEIEALWREELLPQLGDVRVDEVEYYGAGCRGEQCRVVERALLSVFPLCGKVIVDSDLVGAARALFPSGDGIACILGTGSNSGLYIEGKIVKNTSPGGFILGDEGSGASIGKALASALIKGEVAEDVAESFYSEYSLTPDDIIRRVYREPLPNRFLASFAPFVSRHRADPILREMLESEFDRFFRRNILPYGHTDLPVGFIGSIAVSFADEVSNAARRHGYTVSLIKRAPLDEGK